jgi:hypothetical protein
MITNKLVRRITAGGDLAGKESKPMARSTPLVRAETVTWSVDKHKRQFTVGTPGWKRSRSLPLSMI